MEWISLIVGFGLGLIASIWTSIVWERLDRIYNKPVRNFVDIRNRITSALVMYARCHAAPGFVPTDGSPILDQEHLQAAQQYRALSSELFAIIHAIPQKPKLNWWSRFSPAWHWSHYKVTQTNRDLPDRTRLLEAQRSLMGLSNSMFLPAGVKDDKREQAERNLESAKSITNALGIEDMN